MGFGKVGPGQRGHRGTIEDSKKAEFFQADARAKIGTTVGGGKEF